MSRLTTAYIGLGANLGDPIQQLVDARTMLYALAGVVSGRCSDLYLTTPVGYAEQPDFVNCVVELQTALSAQQLFAHMQEIENRLGRRRVTGNQNAPRMIDLDLLLFGDLQIDDSQLVVPHPRLGERLFVLQPLSDLTENEPVSGLGNLSTILQDKRFAGQSVYRLVL